ncbi:MAG: hypothetical protein ACKOXO_12140 [Cyanobium sp.]
MPLLAFLLSAWAVIGNDSLQTLGPFLAANRHRTSRWLQLLFLCALLCGVLWLGWWRSGGDTSWGRLQQFPLPPRLGWRILLAPLAVLLLTRCGAPVSTSFLVLTSFRPAALPALLRQSLLGYGLALLVAAIAYGTATLLGRQRQGNPPALAARPATACDPAAAACAPSATEPQPLGGVALALQWAATGWLWSQWLIQDLANIYVVLPRHLPASGMALSLVVLCGAVALLLLENGGAIQTILQRKNGLQQGRATTTLSLLYGLVLAVLAAWSPVPLSTTWVFLGLLAGRELALQLGPEARAAAAVARELLRDLALAGLGLAVSLAVALGLQPTG